MENKWDINHIQTLLSQAQQKLLRKILEKAFITNKWLNVKHHTT